MWFLFNVFMYEIFIMRVLYVYIIYGLMINEDFLVCVCRKIYIINLVLKIVFYINIIKRLFNIVNFIVLKLMLKCLVFV